MKLPRITAFFSAALFHSALSSTLVLLASTLYASTPPPTPTTQPHSNKGIVHFKDISDYTTLRLVISNVDVSNPDSISLRCSVIDSYGRHVANIPHTLSHPLWARIIERDDNGHRDVENFSVQEVQEAEAPPFSSSFVIDYSASMNDDITNVLLALDNASSFLRPGKDDFSVVQFDQAVETPIAYATDRNALRLLKSFYELGGMTAFYSASQRALRDLAQSDKDRVAILVSDGVDNASPLSANDIVREALASHTRLYIIGLANADKQVLQRIAEQTGGRLYFPTNSAELRGIFADVYRSNSLYYTLRYARPQGATIRDVEVQLRLPDNRHIGDTRTYYTSPQLIFDGGNVVVARFSANQASLDEMFHDEIARVVEYLKSKPEQKIIIRAHSDSKGSHEVNDRLSLRRAKALAQHLITLGVQKNQIEDVQGMGKHILLYPNDKDNPHLQQENRRAELIFVDGTPTPLTAKLQP